MARLRGPRRSRAAVVDLVLAPTLISSGCCPRRPFLARGVSRPIGLEIQAVKGALVHLVAEVRAGPVDQAEDVVRAAAWVAWAAAWVTGRWWTRGLCCWL